MLFRKALTLCAAIFPLVNAYPTTLPMKYARTTLGYFPDPSIVQVGEEWYAYATTNDRYNVQIAKSTDFVSWKLLPTDALPTVGKWADSHKPTVWAPDVIVNGNGQYVMYYSAKIPQNDRHCIGTAVSAHPEGPFIPHDKSLFCPMKKGGAIDASGFKDGDKYFVLHKVDGNSIGNGGICSNTVAPIVSTPLIIQEVEKDGFTHKGKQVQLLDREVLDGPLIEAPSLMRTTSGKYVLFFSSNCYSTDFYDIGYAMADELFGPYRKVGPLATTGTSGLTAPGGLSVAADGKHIAFHANTPAGRALHTASIDIDAQAMVVHTV